MREWGLPLRLAGAFLVALCLALAVLYVVDVLLPLSAVARMALGVALGYLSGRWLVWLVARYEERQGWRDWPEYRSALKKDEARRKAVRGKGT